MQPALYITKIQSSSDNTLTGFLYQGHRNISVVECFLPNWKSGFFFLQFAAKWNTVEKVTAIIVS